MNSIENFIWDALHEPSDAIAYHVGRSLAELYPDKTILEGETWHFDLEAFVRAEKCSIVAESSIFNHIKTEWEGIGKKQKRWNENSWLNVLWQGHLIDVVLITWEENRYRRRHHWIVAEERNLAESFLDAVCEWSCEVRGEILVYHDGYFAKNKELFSSVKTATFENLVLSGSLKEELQNDFTKFLSSREVYELYHIPWKRGAIFIGPPGNGKTHTVKALINQLDKPCIYVRGFKAECGTEQEHMAEVFKRARMTAPCIVVLEDLDAMIGDDNRAFFLNELDGFETNTGVVVIATTNHPEKLDTAILNRPSRFDRKYYFPLPAQNERRAYIASWNAKSHSELALSEKSISEIVEVTEGFSFAYLKELLLSSMVGWMSNGGKGSIHDVISGQATLLRGQIAETKTKRELICR